MSAKRGNISSSEERAISSEKQDITSNWKRCWKNNIRKSLTNFPHFIEKLVNFSFEHVFFISHSPEGCYIEDQNEDFFKNKDKLRECQLNLKGEYKLMLSLTLGPVTFSHSFLPLNLRLYWSYTLASPCWRLTEWWLFTQGNHLHLLFLWFSSMLTLIFDSNVLHALSVHLKMKSEDILKSNTA